MKAIADVIDAPMCFGVDAHREQHHHVLAAMLNWRYRLRHPAFTAMLRLVRGDSFLLFHFRFTGLPVESRVTGKAHCFSRTVIIMYVNVVMAAPSAWTTKLTLPSPTDLETLQCPCTR